MRTPFELSSSQRRSARRVLAATLAQASLLWTPGATAQAPTTAPEITIGTMANPRFAIPDCVPRAGDEASREACRAITQTLRADLKFENLFQFVPDSLYSAIPTLNPDAPKFDDWKGIGAKVLVITRAAVTGGEASVEVKVFFVESGQSMLAKRYTGRADNPRIFAHQASDEIVALTQYRGVARTKIAFTSDRDATKEKRSKELYVMDYDGNNPRRLTVNNSLNILPAWTPDGRGLAYVSYRLGSPDVFLASIFEGRSSNLTNSKNNAQAFAPSFSHDGKKIAYSSNRSGNMEIWVSNADGSDARKVTNHPNDDTAPCWSPTDQEIAFTSNRTGAPQLWVMDSEGLNVRRLSTVGNYNDGCAWNPSKEHPEIAYTSRIEGGFEVAVMDILTHQVRQITEGRGSCEYPAWAPSGRHLVYACNRGGTWQVTVSDRMGQNMQTLPGPGNNSQPDWGP
jgi:TolB protein